MRIRKAWPALVVVVLVGVLFVAVFPTRTWLAQRTESKQATHELEILDGANARLAGRVKALQSDAEIERLAREQYNLVKPGEEAYALLPGQTPQATPTTAPPAADEQDDGDRSLPSKVWHALTGWL